MDPIAQIPIIRVHNHREGHHISDYLGYIVYYLCNADRFTFHDKVEVENMVWLHTSSCSFLYTRR